MNNTQGQHSDATSSTGTMGNTLEPDCHLTCMQETQDMHGGPAVGLADIFGLR